MMERIENQGEGSPGVSLVSTLVVLVTLGALGAVVLTSLPFGDSSSETQTRSVLNELNAPTPAGQAVQGAAAEANTGGSSAGKPPSLPASARTAACRANVGVVETAVATKHQIDSTYPSSIDELVAGRWLDAAPSTVGYEMNLEVVGGQPTGRLLVNGQPGVQGCEAPAAGGK